MKQDDATATRVRSALSVRQDVVEKKMMGGLCFMVTGGMCCSVSGRGGLLVRIAPQARAAILLEPHVEPMVMGGRTMTGFVRVGPEGYQTDHQLSQWVQRGLEAVAELQARPPRPRRGTANLRPFNRTP